MYIKSKIITIQNTDEYIVVNGISDQFNEGPFKLLDTQNVFIKKHRLNSSEELDLTSVCTLPFESSNQVINDFKKQAEGQYEQTKRKGLPKSEFNRYIGNYHKFLAAAKLAESDRLHLPVSIELCGKDKLLVGFVVCLSNLATPYNQEFIGTLRLIDINTAKIIEEKIVQCRGMATKARHLGEFIACSYDGEFALFNSLSKNKLGLGSGQLSIVEKKLFSTFSIARPQKELLPAFRIDIRAKKTSWVVFKHDLYDCNILVLEYITGKILNSIKLTKNSENFDLSLNTNKAAVVHSNGMLSIVDIQANKIVKFRIHQGVAKDSWIGVKISQNGCWVASSISDKELAIVNVKTKKVHKCKTMLGQTIEREEIHTINVDTHIKPVYQFVNDKLVIVDADGTQIINPVDLSFDESEIKEQVLDLSSINKQSSLKEMLDKSNLSSKLDVLEKYYSPSIRLTTKLKKRTFRKELGQSQIGGWPDLPRGTLWPEWNNRPMSFLAQINLSEMHQANPQIKLPRKGLISFFLGCEDDSFEKDVGQCYMVDLMVGSNAENKSGIKVLYTKDLSDLSELRYYESPLPDIYNCCEVSPSIAGNPLPNTESTVYQLLELKGAEIENYNKLLEKVNDDPEDDECWDNLLMGFPQLIQMNPPEIYCERAHLGLDPYQQETKTELKNSANWAMILQLTSDGNPDFLWGDGGHFYFYSHREKAALGDFSESWVYFEN